jgi:hypothetical protein
MVLRERGSDVNSAGMPRLITSLPKSSRDCSDQKHLATIVLYALVFLMYVRGTYVAYVSITMHSLCSLGSTIARLIPPHFSLAVHDKLRNSIHSLLLTTTFTLLMVSLQNDLAISYKETFT